MLLPLFTTMISIRYVERFSLYMPNLEDMKFEIPMTFLRKTFSIIQSHFPQSIFDLY